MKCFLNIMKYKTKEFIDTLTPVNKLWEVLLQSEPLGSCKEKAPSKLSLLVTIFKTEVLDQTRLSFCILLSLLQ